MSADESLQTRPSFHLFPILFLMFKKTIKLRSTIIIGVLIVNLNLNYEKN